MQLNFNLISHNFNPNSTSTFYPFIIFILIVTYSIYKLLKDLYYNPLIPHINTIFYLNSVKIQLSTPYFMVISGFLLFFLFFFKLISFFDLLTELIFTIFGLTFVNSPPTLFFLEIVLYNTILIRLFQTPIIFILLLPILLFYGVPQYVLLPIIVITCFSTYMLLHQLLFLFLLFSIISNTGSLINWGVVNLDCFTRYNLNSVLYLKQLLSIGISSFESLGIFLQNLNILDRPTSIFTLSTTLESNFFILQIFKLSTIQLLITNYHLNIFYISVLDFFLPINFFIYLIILYLIYINYRDPKLIIF